MAQGFKHGGGASLGLRLKAYVTEEALMAAVHRDNTIAVVMPGEISDWVFCSEQPGEAAENMVWICAGTVSPAAVSLSSRNKVMVYPVFAKVYSSGSWNNAKAWIRIAGNWVELREAREYLIRDGVIDMDAHAHSCNMSSYNRVVNGVDYDGKTALELQHNNGDVSIHSFADVLVPQWAKTFRLQYYLLAAYGGYDPVISLGGVSAAVKCDGNTLKDGMAELDVSSIAGTNVVLSISCKGYSDAGYSYIANGWFE